MTLLEVEHALGERGERVEHAAEDDIENGEDDRVEREPNDGERGEVVPGLGDLIGRLADDHHRARALGGNHPHRTADELWPDQAREPGRHIGLDTGALACGDCGDTNVSWPISSMNMMRTWRRCLSWSGNS